MSALGDEDVGRFDVAVDYSFGVGCVERVGNLYRQRQNHLRFHGPPADAVLQRQSIQKLHSDEGLPVLIVDLVDGADVRMVQCRSGLGFALKATECLQVFGYVVGQELESDEAAELHVLGLIDHTHPAPAKFLQDTVMRDGPADHWAQILGLQGGQVNQGGWGWRVRAWKPVLSWNQFYSLRVGTLLMRRDILFTVESAPGGGLLPSCFRFRATGT